MRLRKIGLLVLAGLVLVFSGVVVHAALTGTSKLQFPEA